MNYWDRWIGSWKKKTAALSFIEKGAYGELLDYLYATDCASLPPTKEGIYRVAGAQTAAERAAVDSVLAHVFELRDGVYFQQRVEEELQKRKQFVAGQRDRAIQRWDQQHQKKERTKHGNGEDKQSDVFTLPDWISTHPPLLAAWNAYLEMRKKIRKPATARAMIMACNKLENLRDQGQLPVAVLNQSVLKCWTDVYPLKD